MLQDNGEWNATGYFMKWEDFVRFIDDCGSSNVYNLDKKFKPIVETCSPCSLPFNFIAKSDTLDEGTLDYTVLPRLSVPRLSGIRLSVHWVR